MTRQRAGSKSTGEHFHGRPLLTSYEIIRFGPEQTIVLAAGRPPYLLDRIK
jgi:type IV secretory pathway TraG/TraD family ATPase VirD4